MKKIASLFAVITLAFVGTSLAQQVSTSTTGADDVSFGSRLNRPKPQSSAAPAADNGGKKAVGDAMFATDDKGKNVTSNFPTGTTTVYLLTKNVSGAKGDKVKADWYMDGPKSKHFYSSEVALPNTALYSPSFHASNLVKGAYPAGKYHVDLSVGGEKMKSAKFTVQ